VPYPPFTSDFQFEVELVIAIGRGARDVPVAKAWDCIWGYGVGIDLTRRDRQREARDLRLPWEAGKSFDASAPCGAITPARGERTFADRAITLSVNGIERQRGDTGQMIWSVPEVVAQLSRQVTLRPGDLIFTGTPAGVGPVAPGDVITAHVDGLPPLTITITPPEA
jgi:fumarylpyruvate hydrolase